MTEDQKILVGVIVGAQGIKGQVRVRSFTENPEALAKYKPLTDKNGQREFKLKVTGEARDALVASIAGVTDRNAAEALKGTELYAPRSALPKLKRGEFYAADLAGLVAKDAEGALQGKVIALHDQGAGSYLEIAPVKGKNFMLPFRDAFVPEIDVAAGFLVIDVPDGWI